jgi:hypothetical protein
MAAETLCPSCGAGPIPEDAETCPQCSTRFAANPLYRRARKAGGFNVRKDSVDLEATRTRLGGITGAVDAHPAPTAAVLAAATATWVARCVGLLADRPEPLWPLALAAVLLGVAMLLMISAGPARQLAQLGAVAQLLSGYLAGGPPMARVGYAGAGLALLAMTVGEPGDARRWTAAGVAGVMLGAGVWAVVGG